MRVIRSLGVIFCIRIAFGSDSEDRGSRIILPTSDGNQRSIEAPSGSHRLQELASVLTNALHIEEHFTTEREPFSWDSLRRRITGAYEEPNKAHRMLLKKFLDYTLSTKVRNVIIKCVNKFTDFELILKKVAARKILDDFLVMSQDKVVIIPKEVRELVENCRFLYPDLYDSQEDRNTLLEINAKPTQLEETSIITEEDRKIIGRWIEDKTLSSGRRTLLEIFLPEDERIIIKEEDREAIQKWWEGEHLKAKNAFFQANVKLHHYTEKYCEESSAKYLSKITKEDHTKNVDAICKNIVKTFANPYAKYKTCFATKVEEPKPDRIEEIRPDETTDEEPKPTDPIGKIRPYVCGHKKVDLFEIATCQDENMSDVNYFKISALKKRSSADGESTQYYYALAFDDSCGNTHVVDSCWTYGLEGNRYFKYTSYPHMPLI